MNIEVRPKDGFITIIGEYTKEDIIFHLCYEDESENTFDVILTREQMKNFKKDIVGRTDIDRKRRI